MGKLSLPPLQSPVDVAGEKVSVPWSQWFQQVYNALATQAAWTPTFSGLTVVNGTGGATYTGQYVKLGSLVFWTARVDVTGTCTTASAADTTQITDLPWTVAVANVCHAVNDATASLWTGRVPAGGVIAFPPSWSAYNGGVTISGWYLA